jgi:argininosuccinate lyase
MGANEGLTGGQGASWSNRFDQGLHPAIERFNASIGFDIALLQQDLDGSVAHARMLGRCGLISEQESIDLISGLEAVRQEAAAGSFRPGLECEDVHFAVERRLIELLGQKTAHRPQP